MKRVLATIVCALLLSGCDNPLAGKSCSMIGIPPSGVGVSLLGVKDARGYVVQVCTDTCVSETFRDQQNEPWINLPHPAISSTTPVTITISVRNSSGATVVPATKKTVEPVLNQPDGPDCPKAYNSQVTLTAQQS